MTNKTDAWRGKGETATLSQSVPRKSVLSARSSGSSSMNDLGTGVVCMRAAWRTDIDGASRVHFSRSETLVPSKLVKERRFPT